MSDKDRHNDDRSGSRPRHLVIAGSHPDAELAVQAVGDALRPHTFAVVRMDAPAASDLEQLEDLTEPAIRSAYPQLRRSTLTRDVWRDDGDVHSQQSADTAPDLNWNAVLSDDSRHRGRRVHTMLREMADFTSVQREADNVFVLAARFAVKLARWALFAVPRRRLRRLTTVAVDGVRVNLLEDVLQLRGLWRRAGEAAERADPARQAELSRQQAEIENQVTDRYVAALLADLRHSGMSLLFVGVTAGDAADRLRTVLRDRGAGLHADGEETGEHLHTGAEKTGRAPAWLPPALDRNLRPWPWTALRVGAGAGTEPPRPAPRAGHRVLAWAAGGTALAVFGVLVFMPFGQASFFERWWSGCTGGGVFPAESGECVGVTDGEFVFADVYTELFDKIKRENDDVLASGDSYVSIAILVPYTIGVDDANTVESIVGQVEGAFVAVQKANHGTSGVEEPRVRMLLANVGSEGRQWEPVVRELRTRMAPHVDHLVGVAGLGSSFQATSTFMRHISDAGLPMVASVATADDLLDAAPRAFRVAPSNTDEALALTAYLNDDETVDDGMLVEDLDANNLYARTLADAFRANFESGTLRRFPFHSDANGSVDVLQQAVSKFCEWRPSVVLFAGRGKQDLEDFLRKLADRKCDTTPVRVLTGDDASHLPDDNDLAWALKKADIVLEYAALGHPDQWNVAGAPPDRTHDDMDWFAHQMEKEFPGAKLADGQAIMSFDSVQVLVDAARRTDEHEPDAEDVYNKLLRTADCDLVLGLSGPIAFDSDRNPMNKTIPILRADWRSPVTVVGLTWPDGEISTRSDACS